ncbi:hypothetical protein E2C01_022679 [Portunus trituberculatus]|uniref:Uncharacterized protein n=1 Tax=Portunus trituberculatus TaxID=210409 RepID=A0A5B7E6N4_PORTR|nr:hypothetical protein [Portunus trituberculatus]
MGISSFTCLHSADSARRYTIHKSVVLGGDPSGTTCSTGSRDRVERYHLSQIHDPRNRAKLENSKANLGTVLMPRSNGNLHGSAPSSDQPKIPRPGDREGKGGVVTHTDASST